MLRTLTLVVVLGSTAPLASAEDDAKAQAQEILNKGSAIFDKKDMAAMLATYTEDAQVLWTSKEENATEVRIETKKGRAEIESLYSGAFKESEKTTSKNVVEFARLVRPDLMVIQGTFQPDVSKSGIYPFVQVRVKQGDKWLIKSLQFFVFAQD
jgi:ketosteroid isomerase-like protein